MRRFLPLSGLACSLALLAGLPISTDARSTGARHAANPLSPGKIVFGRHWQEPRGDRTRSDYFVMSGDGRVTHRLPHSLKGLTRGPASPNGQRVAWISGYDFFVADASGRGRQRIWNGSYCRRCVESYLHPLNPAWAPDGRRLAWNYHVDGPPDREQVFLVNADGSGQRVLGTEEAVVDPFWAPDSRRIVAGSGYSVGVGSALLILDSVTGGVSELLRGPPVPSGQPTGGGTIVTPIPKDWPGFSHPAWSPDGRWIAYLYSPGPRVFTVAADGSGARQVSPDRLGKILNLRNDAVFWSPDSSRLAFQTFGGNAGGNAIYSVRPDGSGLKRLTVPRKHYLYRVAQWLRGTVRR